MFFIQRRRERRDKRQRLRAAMNGVDVPAFLVSPRLVRRIIKAKLKDGGLGLQLPHTAVTTITATALKALTDPWERPKGYGDAPGPIILVAESHPRDLDEQSIDELLRGLWQQIYHGALHLCFDGVASDTEGEEDALSALMGELGRGVFGEIRAVLDHEELLQDPHDDRETGVEFLVLYAELKAFQPEVIGGYFPSLPSTRPVDLFLEHHLDGELLQKARPSDAPLTLAPLPEENDEAVDEVRMGSVSPQRAKSLAVMAQRAQAKGSLVRALVLWNTASRLDPQQENVYLDQGQMALEQLIGRLQLQIDPDGADIETWKKVLVPLLARCRNDRFNVEGRLLYDLEKACVAQEQEVHQIGLIAWLRSLGRRPLVRRLPCQQWVRAYKHVRSAHRRADHTRVPAVSKDALTMLLGRVLEGLEASLRDIFQPKIMSAFEEVGLKPTSIPELVAAQKMADELLDKIVARGFVNIADLRDAIAKNDLKLPDLSSPLEFLLGDHLLGADKVLSQHLDGVYRRGEIYLRWLQRVSSMAFGNKLGRWLVKYFIIPFGGGYVLVSGIQHIVGPIVHYLGGPEFALVRWQLVLAVGLDIALLMHVAVIRHGIVTGAKTAWKLTKALFLDLPRALLNLSLVLRIRQSLVYRLGWRFVVKPAIWGGVIWALIPILGANVTASWISAAAFFVVSNGLLNSRLGRRVEEAVVESILGSWRALRYRIVPGFIGWVLEAFATFLEFVDRVIYTVDEWLRLRSGEGRFAFYIKMSLGLVWSLVTYVVRIYINLLIEPQVNPIKHFPVVTVSHKIILPFTLQLTAIMSAPLVPVLGEVAGNTVAAATVFLLPGVFGFLVWELKNNWRLYDSNRSVNLSVKVVGHHSETMLRLMKPGFHSGTLPKLYRKMRKAELKRKAVKVRKCLKGLSDVRHAVRHFMERELAALLACRNNWLECPVSVGSIQLGSNRIRVELCNPAMGSENAVLAFALKGNCLVAGFVRVGWLAALSPAQRNEFRNAIMGVYKRAGVHYIREQIVQWVRAGDALDISKGVLMVFRAGSNSVRVSIPLNRPQEPLPVLAGSDPERRIGELAYGRYPISYVSWVDVWEKPPEMLSSLQEMVVALPRHGLSRETDVSAGPALRTPNTEDEHGT